MTDEESFLDAIRREPADAALRLVYADWLQERGEDERSEFLRAEDRLGRAAEPGDLTRWLELSARVPAPWLDALGTRVNRLPLPADLADRLARGLWASRSESDTRAVPWGRPFAYSLATMRTETDNVCGRLSWLGEPDPADPPGDIDPRLTVMIGDEGLGSDAPFALDYRAPFARPRVLLYRWRTEGNRWVEVAPHFAAEPTGR